MSREEGDDRSSLSLELEGGGHNRRKVGRTVPPPPQPQENTRCIV